MSAPSVVAEVSTTAAGAVSGALSATVSPATVSTVPTGGASGAIRTEPAVTAEVAGA